MFVIRVSSEARVTSTASTGTNCHLLGVGPHLLAAREVSGAVEGWGRYCGGAGAGLEAPGPTVLVRGGRPQYSVGPRHIYSLSRA